MNADGRGWRREGPGARGAWAAIALLLAFVAVGCDGKPAEPRPPSVQIRDHRWYVDLAMTQETRSKGLSRRQQLADDVGMLFVYPRQQVLDYCMRDCVIPLDIAFIDKDLRVVKMYTMQVEPDLREHTAYSSEQPVQYALEVAGGALRRAGVQVGDRVTFSPEIPPAAKAEDGL